MYGPMGPPGNNGLPGSKGGWEKWILKKNTGYDVRMVVKEMVVEVEAKRWMGD